MTSQLDDQPTEPGTPPSPALGGPTGRRYLLPVASLLAITAIVVVATRAWRQAGPAEEPAVIVLGDENPSPFKGFILSPERPAPDFTLTDTAGAPFRLGETRGRVTMVFFGFTYCPDVCPTTLTTLSRALADLGPDAERVSVVFVSVDPERDTPAVLRRYLAAFDPRIVGVTGDDATLERVASDYGVRFFKEFPKRTPGTPEAAADYTMAHTTTVFVIDPFGQLRASFMGSYTPQDVVHDVRVLLEEAG